MRVAAKSKQRLAYWVVSVITCHSMRIVSKKVLLPGKSLNFHQVIVSPPSGMSEAVI